MIKMYCVGCHSSAQPGGRGGVVQIVGATIGEMNNTLSSRHTASGIGFDPLNEECEACHFDNGTSHPTSIMMLRNPDAAAAGVIQARQEAQQRCFTAAAAPCNNNKFSGIYVKIYII